MSERKAIVANVYRAFGEGDGEALSRLLADTEWHEAEGMPYGGTYRGFAEVAANVFGPIGRDVQQFTAVPDQILDTGEHQVLATGRYRGTGAAGTLDVPFAHLWTVEDAAITRFVQYADTHLFRQAVTA